jgi:pimeloyl-ACP methyl ester carboxylesterase
MLLRPLWPDSDPQAIRDWSLFSEDLRRLLKEQEAANVIGIGHSIGALVTLRAALREPELFQALVLIDPVLLPRRRMLQLRIVRALGLAHRMNARIEGALRRRRHFDDLEQLFNGYRRRDVFRFFSDKHLRTLIHGMTRQTTDGAYELVYSPEWEARIYETGIWNDWDIWAGLKRLRIPTLILRGAETDTFWQSTGRIVEKANPAIKIRSLPSATHLLPLEKPVEVFDATEQFLERLKNVKSM